MISNELFSKIRKLEIRTKGLVNDLFSGEYNSAFKGRGMAFSEVRPYQFGDDIRAIDWNVTARNDEPFIKIFEEEREQTLMLCLDISHSGVFGSGNQNKKDLSVELCAVLAFSAIKNNDKVGLILFSDVIEKVIPPRKGRSHVLRLIREMLVTEPKGSGTDIDQVMKYANGILKRRSIVVLISDFQATPFEKQLRITNKRHDLVTFIIQDHMESELPDLGLIPVTDAENGATYFVDTSNKILRDAFLKKNRERSESLMHFFRKHNIDALKLHTNTPYIEPLTIFLHQRHLHR